MKRLFIFFAVTGMLSACKSNNIHYAIGAEKIEKYMQPGYKPKTKQEKAEYKIVMAQVKQDMKTSKKPPKSSSTY